MKKSKSLFAILGAAALVAVLGIAALGILFQTTEANATDWCSWDLGSCKFFSFD